VDAPDIKIVDAIRDPELGKFLYKCLAPITHRPYRKRTRYYEGAVPGGLGKEVLFLDGAAVGMIEYAPVGASGYPISGEGVWVMNCVWVLRRAKGHRLGRMLMGRMLEAAEGASGFATIALEGHHSPWLRLPQMEYLGFRSIDSMRMRHRVKWPEVCFRTHLMWMPLGEGSEPPVMDWGEMLRGVDFCIAHPLYRAERLGLEAAFEEC
jgi:GNAT superfamily N-acetyltransferase